MLLEQFIDDKTAQLAGCASNDNHGKTPFNGREEMAEYRPNELYVSTYTEVSVNAN
jgi:hypothetical protein